MPDPGKTKSLAPGERPDSGSPVVTGFRRLDTGEEFELGGTTAIVGMAPDCDWRIEEECVSRIHCRFEIRDEHCFASDQSRNGTFVNARQIHEVEVLDQDVVTFGRVDAIAFSARSRGTVTARERMRGTSPLLQQAKAEAAQAFRDDRNLLVVGEVGTGRELLCRWAHETVWSAARPFVVVDCSDAFADFDVVAFDTLATDTARATLFVKEAENIPRNKQTAVMRTLRAPHLRSALSSTRAGERELLGRFARMDTAVAHMPTLAERRGDTSELIDWFLREVRKPRQALITLRPETRAAFMRHDWPGNVAELRDAVHHIAALVRLGTLRKVETECGIPRTSLARWLKRLGIPTRGPW